MLSRLDAWLHRHKGWCQVWLLLSSLAGLAYITGPTLWHPNALLYDSSGDAGVLYYDLMYHVLHGDWGHRLDAMLYPHAELLFLTDAQGALTLLLQSLARLGIDLSDYAIGIVHSLNHLSVWLSSVLIYMLLLRLGIRYPVALLMAPLLCLMSPQIVRLYGHFGLAYPMLIPLSVLWLLRDRKHADRRDLLMVLIFGFFTFNNPYVGFSAGLSMGLAALGIGLFRPSLRMQALIPALGMAVVLLGSFAYFKAFDFHAGDRLDQQWGAFAFRVSAWGSLVPEFSLLRSLLQIERPLEFEARQYLGIVPVIILAATAMMWVAKTLGIKRLRGVQLPKTSLVWSFYVLAALLVYLFCYEWPFTRAQERWIESHAGFVLMFKAMARLAWPFYLAMGVSAALLLDAFLLRIERRSSALAGLLFLFLGVLGAADIAYYYHDRYPERKDNVFSSAQRQKDALAFAEMGIDPASYQALLGVPRHLSWHDNVLTQWNWPGHRASMRASLALGLPMLQAHLGRAPTGKLMEVTQLLSDPLIDAGPLLDTLLQDGRDVLLVLSRDQSSMTKAERWVLAKADTLGQLEDASYWRLQLAVLARARKAYQDSLLAEAQRPDTTAGPLYLESYNTYPSPLAYASVAALSLAEGRHELLDWEWTGDTRLVALRIWARNRRDRYGLGIFHLQHFSSVGELLWEEQRDIRSLGDADGMWFGYAQQRSVSRGERLKLAVEVYDSLLIDELSITYTERPWMRVHAGDTLLNGVRWVAP